MNHKHCMSKLHVKSVFILLFNLSRRGGLHNRDLLIVEILLFKGFTQGDKY